MGTENLEILAQKFEAYNDIPALVLVANRTGDIVFANSAVKDVLGYTPKEVLGSKWYTLTDTGDIPIASRRAALKQILLDPTNLKSRNLYESALKAKDGKLVWTQWTNNILDGNLLLGVGQDITEKRILKDILDKKHEENELLVKEVHHRVKNNLQIISSLLNLQFKDLEDVTVKKAVDKSKIRINAMALAHNMVHKSMDVRAIDFSEYLNDLVDSICDSHVRSKSIDKTVRPCKATFNADKTILLGLIITELVTNVLEHAYDTDFDNILEVSLNKISENEHQLLVRDKGVGMSNRSSSQPGFGLELVSSLCEQMDAEMKILNGQGTTVDVRF